MISNLLKQFLAPSLSLFSSFSTLICCALPVFLVTLGMGASLVGLLTVFPWIVVLSKFKIQMFLIAGLLLIISGYLFLQGRNTACPSDPIQAKICSKLRVINLIILLFSLTIYLIGFFFAFLAVNIFY